MNCALATNNTTLATNNTALALAVLRRRGRLARAVLDGAESGRRARAARVNVITAAARCGGGLLVAAVARKGGGSYSVEVNLDARNGVEVHCTCPDHGRRVGGACKHALAVLHRWVTNHARPAWAALTAATGADCARTLGTVAEICDDDDCTGVVVVGDCDADNDADCDDNAADADDDFDGHDDEWEEQRSSFLDRLHARFSRDGWFDHI